MSIQAVAWVLDSSESRGITRLVLLSLANHANEEAVCWPAQRTIAREAGIGTGTVSAALQRLVAIGEIEVVKPGTARLSTTYRLARLPSAASTPGVSAASTSGPRRIIRNHQEPSSAHLPSTGSVGVARMSCVRCHGSGTIYNATGGFNIVCTCVEISAGSAGD
jgi:hypothetical protein